MRNLRFLSKILVCIFMVTTVHLAGCGTAPVKKAVSTHSSQPHVPLNDLVLSKAIDRSRYGVLMGVFFNANEANTLIERSIAELKKTGVKDPIVVPLRITDAKNKKAIAVVAGQYTDLANAHYLQRILTRVIPGQYNLVTVPSSIWVQGK